MLNRTSLPPGFKSLNRAAVTKKDNMFPNTDGKIDSGARWWLYLDIFQVDCTSSCTAFAILPGPHLDRNQNFSTGGGVIYWCNDDVVCSLKKFPLPLLIITHPPTWCQLGEELEPTWYHIVWNCAMAAGEIYVREGVCCFSAFDSSGII